MFPPGVATQSAGPETTKALLSYIAQPSAVFVILITAIWPVVINTAVGVRNVP